MPRVFTLLLFVAGLWCASTTAQERRTDWLDESKWPAFVQDRPLKIGGEENELAKLLKQRYNAALVELRHRYIYWLQGQGALVEVGENAQRLVASRLEIDSPLPDRVKIFTEKLAFAEVLAQQSTERHQAARRADNATDEIYAPYFLLNAKVELARAKKDQAKSGDKE